MPLSFDVTAPRFFIEAKPTLLTPAEAADIALKPLEGKTPVPQGQQKTAIILHGHPGAGKTHQGYEALQQQQPEFLEHTVIVSYDEHGALYDISGFQQDIAQAQDPR